MILFTYLKIILLQCFQFSIFNCIQTELILLKLKTKNWKHYTKIIFKYVNSAIKLIFNEKIIEK